MEKKCYEPFIWKKKIHFFFEKKKYISVLHNIISLSQLIIIISPTTATATKKPLNDYILCAFFFPFHWLFCLDVLFEFFSGDSIMHVYICSEFVKPFARSIFMNW